MTFSKQFLESDMRVATLPGGNKLLAALAGIPVIERPDVLRYDEMYFGQGAAGIVVGEQRHFLYRMKMLDLNEEVRAKAIARIRASARKMLGDEDWKLSPK